MWNSAPLLEKVGAHASLLPWFHHANCVLTLLVLMSTMGLVLKLTIVDL